jgi:hypothetical protein
MIAILVNPTGGNDPPNITVNQNNVLPPASPH